MIALIGLNHKSAPVEIRENFVFTSEDINEFSKLFKPNINFKGMFVVSTCNRTEIYIEIQNNSEKEIFDTVIDNLSKFKNCKQDISGFIYTYGEKKAVNHLFKVACGLDSMMLGEYQIVGQLKDAYTICDEHKIISSNLRRLSEKAFETGKKVRTETKINEGAVTVSYAAVEAAYLYFKDLKEKNILSIGAGETGQLVLSSLVKKGCTKLTVANRTHEKAVKVAKYFNAEAIEFDELDRRILEFDIILVSTASKTPLVTAERVNKLMKKRQDKPLLMIDLSVPRNIEPEVGSIENVTLFDVDNLQDVVKENYDKRKGEIAHAQNIIDKLVIDFISWLSTRNLGQTFSKISDNFREINRKEIEGFQKNKIQIDYTKAVEYGDHITNKYIRLLIKNIKTVTDNGKKADYIKMVNELFELQ